MAALSTIVWVHAVSTLMMTGLIWFVQLVHYPLMRQVGESGFARYEREHTRRTTWIVAPLMLAEAATTGSLVLYAHAPTERLLSVAGAALLLVIWISTAALQVPCHRKLTKGFDKLALERLVRSNWIRTFAWTVRSAIAVGLPIVMATTGA